MQINFVVKNETLILYLDVHFLTVLCLPQFAHCSLLLLPVLNIINRSQEVLARHIIVIKIVFSRYFSTVEKTPSHCCASGFLPSHNIQDVHYFSLW
jgi:hypothetical protein